MLNRTALATVVLITSLGLAACAEKPPVSKERAITSTAAPAANITPIAAGTALPAGYKVDLDRTIIFGTNEAWTGRLSYSTAAPADEVFDFLHKEMPNFGWAEVTAMRSDPSVFIFTSSSTGRTATISIVRAVALGSTKVDMVVAASSGTPAR